MARNGVWQLQRLTLAFCDWGGSSRGARQFIAEVLPTFTQENPQLAVSTRVHRGRHPFLKAEYSNTSKRVVDVKNKGAEEILEHSLWLRGSAGRKTAHRVKKRQVSQQPSTQGTWRPDLDLPQQLKWANGSAPSHRGAAADAAGA